MSYLNDVYRDIAEHIQKSGSPPRFWYAGITSDPSSRLFVDHNVQKDIGWCISRDAQTENGARSVEQALLRLGCDGGPGGGNASTKYVYAYLKTGTTRE